MDGEVEAVIARLGAFRAEHRHLYVHTHYKCDDGFLLGQWVMRRRSEKRRYRLHPRYEVLDAVPGWDWQSVDARLLEGLYRLEEYVERNGTARVPLWYECDDGLKLGAWVRNRRNGPERYPWLSSPRRTMLRTSASSTRKTRATSAGESIRRRASIATPSMST